MTELAMRPLCIALISVTIGFIVAFLSRPAWLAGMLPVFLTSSIILFLEITKPYAGGGFDFWPIAVLVAGAIGFICGIIGFFLMDVYRRQ